MTIRFPRPLFFATIAAIGVTFLASCAVDQNASLETTKSAAKKKASDTETISWAEKNEARKAERELKRAEAAKQKAKDLAAQEKKKAAELAAKKKADAAEARKLAAEKKAEAAKEKAIAAREARIAAKDAAAESEAEAEKIAAKEQKKAAKLAAKRKAQMERDARQAANDAADQAIAARDERSNRSRGRGGFFGRSNSRTPSEYQSEGHDVFVNKSALASLNSSNAKIEISIGEQRARVYNTSGGSKTLVIDTRVSTGKSGHTTPTGTWKIKEKLVAKRSTLYGRWVNSSGTTIQSSGDSRARPRGGSSFVGAEMPYWMRITGGIGMHIGYVPNYPASHGCIRVPAAVQPLIYSKVGVGTSVTISY